MLVREVRLTNVRAQSSLKVTLGEGLTVVVGPNGAGKTTLLESLYLLLTGVPLRASSTKDMIRREEEVLRVECTLLGPGTLPVTAAVAYSRDGTRRLTADGAPLEDASRWRELVPIRTFVPDDLRLIKGSPRRRREYLDRLSGQRRAEYAATLRRYEEALAQRNALLRMIGPSTGSAEFAPWEEILAETGPALYRLRAEALGSFIGSLQQIYAELTGDVAEALHVVYRSNVAGVEAEEYRARLAEMRVSDRQRTFTQLGPHRDDFRLLRRGLDVREYASQGEQRIVLLCLVLAEWRGLAAGYEGGRRAAPLLLLDDVMSELDEDRRRRLLELVLKGGQVIITATDLRYFTGRELEQATVVELGKGDAGGATDADRPGPGGE